jgi:hypothetical protein
MRRIIGCLAKSGWVGAWFSSAVVLAQVGGGAPGPATATAKQAAGLEDAAGRNGKTKKALDPAEVRNRAIVVEAEALQKAAVRRGVVQKAAQPNRAPLIQQFTQQARPLLRAEIIFARNVCHLNQDELRKVNAEAQKMLEEVIAKLVEAQAQPRVRVVQGQGRMPNSLDAQQLLQDGVVSVMKKTVSPDQWSVYEAEKQKRDETRKRATVRYFVDAIDRELYLAPEQCSQLEVALKEKWDAAWMLYLENHLFGNKYYPMTIDPVVTPILTDAQKRVWAGVQKVGIYWGFGGMLAGFANDGDALEIELGEPAKPDVQIPQLRRLAIEAVEGQGHAAAKASVKMKAAVKKVGKAERAAPDPEKKADKTSD